MTLISPTTGLNDLSGIFLLQSAQTFHKNGQFRPIRGIVLAAERGRRRASETVVPSVLKLTKCCFNTFTMNLLDSAVKWFLV